MRRLVVSALLLGGCSDSRFLEPGGETGSESSPGPSTDAGSDGTTSSGVDSSSSGTAPSGDESSTGFFDATSFLQNPDGGSPSYGCSPWDQNCPPGEKCMAHSYNGDPWWNGTRCVPIADDPGGSGDPCTVEGNALSGMDDCDFGLMCWDVDPDTNTGQCQPLCIGSELSPVCEDPTQICWVNSDGILTLCVDTCAPLAPDCPGTQGCYPADDRFVCAPEISGDEGAFGERCANINACDAGLACIDGAAVPGCDAGFGCCSPYCDTTAANACPGEGQECVPWFDPADAPAGLETTGICSLL